MRVLRVEKYMKEIIYTDARSVVTRAEKEFEKATIELNESLTSDHLERPPGILREVNQLQGQVTQLKEKLEQAKSASDELNRSVKIISLLVQVRYCGSPGPRVFPSAQYLRDLGNMEMAVDRQQKVVDELMEASIVAHAELETELLTGIENISLTPTLVQRVPISGARALRSPSTVLAP